eukprot:CAMPEP_0116873874 /NCGR_PEP_ID=MMETSP0463-20121206/5200_1 /TAXON_ID=181622 /ORGANISM="Strombidinopsis sp, Strain SopsisLIS2011" /LENGTH=105 /DNA_ID=CAMNT_0004516683 /DNA_START=720 /DNA_END=1037 /DNA_ORIENTATION=+
MFDLWGYMFYSSSRADLNEIFYQDEESEDWKLLNSITKEIEINNYDKYSKKMTENEQGLGIVGASFYMTQERAKNTNSFVQMVQGVSYAAAFATRKKEALDYFRY